MENIPELNQYINQFTITYYDNFLLVHEYIIRKSGFFDGLLNFYNNSNLTYNINHPIDITESLQEIKLDINDHITTKMIEDTFIFIMKILYQEKVCLSTYKYDYKYILILFDYYDLPKSYLSKLINQENIRSLKKYYRIRRGYLPTRINSSTFKIEKIYSSKLLQLGIKYSSETNQSSLVKKISPKYLTTENILSIIRYLFLYSDLLDDIEEIFYDRIKYLF